MASQIVPSARDAVEKTQSLFGVKFSISGRTDWLKSHYFSFKKAQGIPAKADAKDQQRWIEAFDAFVQALPEKI